VNNTAQPLGSSTSNAAIVFGRDWGFELSEVVFLGNSGKPIWGNSAMYRNNSRRFVFNGCFFDTAPTATAYVAANAIFVVTAWVPTITIFAPDALLCGPCPSMDFTIDPHPRARMRIVKSFLFAFYALAK
jgi:hypothetical protein